MAKRRGGEDFVAAFGRVWADLFDTPVHLDSLLAKQPPSLRRRIAETVTPILLRPRTIARASGISLGAGEPWSVPRAELAGWRVARAIALAMDGDAALAERGEPDADDFPPGMIESWRAWFGRERADELARTLADRPPLSLRVSRRESLHAVRAELPISEERSGAPLRIERSEISPVGLRVFGHLSVSRHPLLRRGAIEVQDEGSQVMSFFALSPAEYAGLLSGRPGRTFSARSKPAELPEGKRSLSIVDACAGAGGKALAIADALEGKGRVFAYDISARKLEALRARAKRAHLTSIKTAVVEDGREHMVTSHFAESADIVLVDAPCSGWGVLRRNPDIKWRQREEDLARLERLQARLIDTYADLVRPGGRLIYGVCTFRPEETSGIIAGFLARRPDFWPTVGGFLGPGPSDGFFMQALERATE